MPTDIQIEVVENPGGNLIEAVYYQLRTYNQISNPIFWQARDEPANHPKQLHVFAFAEDRTVIGGLFGTTRFSWLKIDTMATREGWRRKGVGTALLARAEAVAKESGCRYAYTDTMEYQAPDFYQKAGYKIAGELDDWDSHGHKKLFFIKGL